VARVSDRGSRRRHKHVVVPVSRVLTEEGRPVRGVKLKTASAFTMLFALACLAAFMAGRPPASAEAPVTTKTFLPRRASKQPLRHNDARHLFRSALGKRESGAKKAEKSAGAGTPVRFLPANAKQKNQQTENV